jgi:hypothetical protein
MKIRCGMFLKQKPGLGTLCIHVNNRNENDSFILLPILTVKQNDTHLLQDSFSNLKCPFSGRRFELCKY